MGQNALLMYVLVAEGLFPAALQGLYWREPENNLVTPICTNFQSLSLRQFTVSHRLNTQGLR